LISGLGVNAGDPLAKSVSQHAGGVQLGALDS
jgi:hypothetical protein